MIKSPFPAFVTQVLSHGLDSRGSRWQVRPARLCIGQVWGEGAWGGDGKCKMSSSGHCRGTDGDLGFNWERIGVGVRPWEKGVTAEEGWAPV
jgi:hypothetical protein